MKLVRFSLIIVCVLVLSCSKKEENQTILSSPDSNIKVEFGLNLNGEAIYQVTYKNEDVVKTSTLGFDLKNAPLLTGNFEITNAVDSSVSLPLGLNRNGGLYHILLLSY